MMEVFPKGNVFCTRGRKYLLEYHQVRLGLRLNHGLDPYDAMTIDKDQSQIPLLIPIATTFTR